jgi:hypothetical protein
MVALITDTILIQLIHINVITATIKIISIYQLILFIKTFNAVCLGFHIHVALRITPTANPSIVKS